MRRLALLGGVALAAAGCSGGGGGSGTPSSGTPPPASTASYGSAEISAHATGTAYDRTVVVRAKDKKSGVPVQGARVSVWGQMISPHLMSLIPRDLHEVGRGTYKGRYSLIMKGQWTLNIEVRSKKEGTSTSALPVKIG
ncbi:MAG TPA: FixH family protein [Gaiellaceae bacterium]|nr:FixH family protein [Gaiellaceae bacterium]